jgi:plastocyanin
MTSTTKIISSIAIGIVIIVGITGFALLSRSDTDKNSGGTASHGTENQSIATITYTDEGFNPDSLTVKVGNTITIKNSSTGNLQFSSDNHPSHTENVELNQTELAPDQSQNITLTKQGTWGYHNHLDPSKTGTIIVE